ncbi:hypothetical protein B9Z55_011742 [Caenorhabditis nigoni]|uniref:Uncharacterized protein n=2 Tax=Caenorhabditis nigoni TaxID=1611254 RepID=A0A2G5ULH6_9PELO|nr:hypothetical protein B9Z55_011742 [Caenorhabditis nigoni]
MPTVPAPKIRKKKKAETPRKIFKIDIVSDADRSPSPMPTIDLTMDSEDEEIQIPDILPEREAIPEGYLSPHLPRSRLLKWYHSRKLENEKKQKILTEKREIREKLEKEREETQRSDAEKSRIGENFGEK